MSASWKGVSCTSLLRLPSFARSFLNFFRWFGVRLLLFSSNAAWVLILSAIVEPSPSKHSSWHMSDFLRADVPDLSAFTH